MISNQNNFSYFYLQVTPMLPTKFSNGSHGGHLGFWMGTIGAIFDLQDNPMLPTKI